MLPKVNSCRISSIALNSIYSEIKEHPYEETGGLLTGYYIDEAIVIESASGSSPNSTRSLIEFTNEKEYMDRFLDEQYALSKGKEIYIGEWHSHPQTFPRPSNQDFQSFYERSMEWEYGQLIFLIVGFIGLEEDNILSQTIAISYFNEVTSFRIIDVVKTE